MICQVCGKDFDSNYDKRRRFCSRKCYGISIKGHASYVETKRIIKTCECCGKDFVTGGRLGRQGKKFCSKDCQIVGHIRSCRKVNNITIEDAAYLAGFVDGEGSIILHRSRDRTAMRIAITNTNKGVIDWIQTITGVGNIVEKKSKNAKHKDCYIWLCNSQSAEDVLIQILPYLKIKIQQAELAINLQQNLRIPNMRYSREWQLEYYLQMRELNKRGQ